MGQCGGQPPSTRSFAVTKMRHLRSHAVCRLIFASTFLIVSAASTCCNTFVCQGRVTRGVSHSHLQRRNQGRAWCVLRPPERYSSDDWLDNLKSLPASRIAARISNHLFFNTLWALLVTIIYEVLPASHTPWHVSSTPHSLMGSALGLLLVFRTNAAYDRFWEAYKIWEQVTNVCRNLARAGGTGLPPSHHPRLAALLGAYAMTLRAHLQQLPVCTEIEDILPTWEAEQTRRDANPPALVCCKLTHHIRHGMMPPGSDGPQLVPYPSALRPQDFREVSMDNLVGDLINCLGQAERILLAPVPASYSRHTSRLLSFYCFTLPFVLVPELRWYTAPVLGAMCWGLFATEELGHLIEEPFSVEGNQIPLEQIAASIGRDARRFLRVGKKQGREVDEQLLTTEDRDVMEQERRRGIVERVGENYERREWKQKVDVGI